MVFYSIYLLNFVGTSQRHRASRWNYFCSRQLGITVVELQKLTKLFNLTADQIMNYDENIIPKEVIIEDKSTIEQMQLLQQLDEEDKSTVFKIIDKMLTTKKFKDFFAKNVATL